MLTRLIRIQLIIFSIITIICVGAIALFYLRLPASLGIGVYNITAEFAQTGGLYKNANVTYRGVTVGSVRSVELTHDSVEARMRLNSNYKIPDNVTATVKSVSALGEQYVDLVPPKQPSKNALHNDAIIDQSRTSVGQDIEGLLKQADALVGNIGNARLQDLLREAFKAFHGTGPDLARLVESARLLVDEANANWPETSQLIDQIGPLLEAQVRSGDDIGSLTNGLARFTSQLRQADPQLRALLTTAPGAAGEANNTFSGIRPSFPALAASLANLGRVGVIYNKSIEQALVIFPALMSALITVAGGVPTDEGGKLDFKLTLGDPPPCNTGFLPPQFIRPPADQTLRDLPKDMYCKTPQNDPTAVRGARNYPCQEFPGKRAPTIQLCRDPRGYVPLGSNPWRGPPVPTGTPTTDPRNTLPPNKFPYISPESDPDPGYPVVPGAVPPGVQPGPGPAPHQPWPEIPPPNDPNAPPPPFTAWVPPAPYPDAWPAPANPQPPPGPLSPGPYQPVVPPPGPALGPAPAVDPGAQPPAVVTPPGMSGASYSTYDQHSGTFIDANGKAAVYAPGADNLRPQENWVDLMVDPRQT